MSTCTDAPQRQEAATPEGLLRDALKKASPGTFAEALYRRALAPDATPSTVRWALDHARADWRQRARQLEADRAATTSIRDLRTLRGAAPDREPAGLRQLLLAIEELRAEVREAIETPTPPARPTRPGGLAGV